MLSQDTIVPSPRYNYPNGDLVLLVADPSCFIAFKVHRKMLMEASTVFNDALSLESPEEDVQYDGVPALKLYDTVHEACLLLEGIYSPSSIFRSPSCQDDLQRLDRFLRICDKYDFKYLLARMANVLNTYISSLLEFCDGNNLILPLDVYPTLPPKARPPGFLPEPCQLLSIFLQFDLTDLIAPAAFYLYRISRASSCLTPTTPFLPIPQLHHLPVPYRTSIALSQLRMDMAIQALYASVVNMMGWSYHRCWNSAKRDACHAALHHYARVYRARGGHLTRTGLPLIERNSPELRELKLFCRECECKFRYLVMQERKRFIEELVPQIFGSMQSNEEAEDAFARCLEGWIAPVDECAKAPWLYGLAPVAGIPEELSWTVVVNHCWKMFVSSVF